MVWTGARWARFSPDATTGSVPITINGSGVISVIGMSPDGVCVHCSHVWVVEVCPSASCTVCFVTSSGRMSLGAFLHLVKQTKRACKQKSHALTSSLFTGLCELSACGVGGFQLHSQSATQRLHLRSLFPLPTPCFQHWNILLCPSFHLHDEVCFYEAAFSWTGFYLLLCFTEPELTFIYISSALTFT